MTYDPMEWTVRDPLEDTVPDPIERGRRLSDGKRRAVELTALVVLVPGLLATQWIDNQHQGRQYQTRERVTVVPRGGTGTLGHLRLRLLGRDTTGPSKSTGAPAGSARLKLVVNVRPFDAQGVKDVDTLGFTVRDRDGHVWSAAGSPDRDQKASAGADTQVSVTATVPERVVSAVVLEVRPGGLVRKTSGPTPVLRFAH
jgi:hypothetical protein